MAKRRVSLIFLLLLAAAAGAQTETVLPDQAFDPSAGPDTEKKISVQGKDGSAGGRSELSITEFITSKLPGFMRIYASRLLEKPGLGGKISFNFAIDEYGSVPFCNIVNSAVGDDTLEDRLSDFIMSWKFDTINIPGDITIVTYPFDFAQDKTGGIIPLAGAGPADGRSNRSLSRAIKRQKDGLRPLYRARLTERPGLKGTVWCRFVIDEQGNVVSCRVDSSTVRDTTLEKRLAACITGWKFDRTGTPGDLLSVTYPFVFSPGGKSSNGAFIATVTAVLSLCALAAVLFL